MNLSAASGRKGTPMPCQPAPSHAHVVREGSGAVTARGKRLLLLEDNEALRRILAWELADLGYDVEPAGSCREARAAVSCGSFELAILDVGLPDGDGIALAGELVTEYPRLRILLCSGQHGAFSGRVIPVTVLACLAKPVSSQCLDELLRTPDAEAD